MSESFFSQLWYRVSGLKPALKPNLEIALHSYRGAPWYVVRDPVSGKVHRFSGQSYALIGAMTGGATVADIWKASLDRLKADAPSQEDVLRLLMQLHQSDLLLVDSVPLADELVERMSKTRRQKRSRYWKNPMSLPLPLFDPDRLLEALAPLVRGRIGWVWAVLWVVLVGAALVTLPAHWQDLTSAGLREILALGNLAILACVYPVVKAIHELAHGLAAKRFGGEVHETGVMFLVFFPVPYVDASSSAAFPDKYARALVGAAGILAEIALAAAALFVWAAAEPGLVRDVAYNVMFISGFSTLVVNGNPLLKFDGYFVFCDLLEMPNLGQRANAWWGNLLRRWLLNSPATNVRPVSRMEAAIFAVYAPAAFVYRLFVMVGIGLYVAGSYFAIGVALVCWSVIQGLVMPAYKVVSQFFRDQRLAERR
ncbi:MAG: PqqD family protein, partial [Rhodobiaceae bacterium]|nr:PqqD family protein [Rhodobiaceae bacterium]